MDCPSAANREDPFQIIDETGPTSWNTVKHNDEFHQRLLRPFEDIPILSSVTFCNVE